MSGNLLKAPRIYMYVGVCVCVWKINWFPYFEKCKIFVPKQAREVVIFVSVFFNLPNNRTVTVTQRATPGWFSNFLGSSYAERLTIIVPNYIRYKIPIVSCLIWFRFFVWWLINLCRLSNAKTILVQEQLWYYLNLIWRFPFQRLLIRKWTKEHD